MFFFPGLLWNIIFILIFYNLLNVISWLNMFLLGLLWIYTFKLVSNKLINKQIRLINYQLI